MLPGDISSRYAVVLSLAALAACRAAQPPEAPSPFGQSEATAPIVESVDTGRDCATAEVRCGGGMCAVKVKNGCAQAIWCELSVIATCEAQGGASSDADGKARDNFAAGSTGEMSAQATCTSGQVLHTEVRKLACQ